jgi:hypothetical protein
VARAVVGLAIQGSCASYFYLRALQRNGGIIYASPVFIAMK